MEGRTNKQRKEMTENTLLEVIQRASTLEDQLLSIQELIHKKENDQQKLYNYCHEIIPTLSRRQLRAIFDRKQNIQINGDYMGSEDEYRRLKMGDKVNISITVRDFIVHSAEYEELQIFYQDHSICLIEKPSNVNSVKGSLFECAYRLKCWDGLYYDTCHCLYSIPKHGTGIMIIVRRFEQLRDLFYQFQKNQENHWFVMSCITSSSVHPEEIIELDDNNTFDVINSLRIETKQVIMSRSYGFVSLQSITPKLRVFPENLSIEESLKYLELLSIDLKRIKHVLQRNHITIIGLDYVGKQGKGVYSTWNKVSLVSPDLLRMDVRVGSVVTHELALPGKFAKFLEKEEYFLDLKNKKSRHEDLLKNGSRKELERPIEYQRGVTEFGSLELIVNEAVMIPRQSSFAIVQSALESANLITFSPYFIEGKKDMKVLDLGTGSGSLLLAIHHQLPQQLPEVVLSGFGIDVSEDAIDVANQNKTKLCLDDSISFAVGNFADYRTWMPTNSKRFSGYDIIVCNPPYSSPNEKRRLSVTSKMYEPSIALFADDIDPLKAYRQLASALAEIEKQPSLLIIKKHAYFILEIGAGQLESVQTIFQVLSPKWFIQSLRKDHKNIVRVMTLCRVLDRPE